MGFMDIAKLRFRYHESSAGEKLKLLERVKRRLKDFDGVVFAYIHGGFIKRSFFKDLDIAIWIKDLDKAFYYTVDFSAKLEVEIGVPVDIQVLNKAPLPFKHYIFTQGELLLSKDEGLRLRLANETIRQYIDLKYLIRMASGNLRKA